MSLMVALMVWTLGLAVGPFADERVYLWLLALTTLAVVGVLAD